ncbi:MAG: chaperone modulator CbpM [Methylotenera sp.]|nr:chaperone modulator CbpM [Methylotenera sp.]
MNIDFSELIWLDDQHEVSLDELIELSGLTQQELRHLVESGALIPNNPADDDWQFNSHCVVSVRTLSRLKQDFELEPNAFALTLVFLERIRTLELQLQELNPEKTE